MTGPVEPFEIVRVTDTREFVEDGDRWVALAGTGDARPCDRCGLTHEIHAEVLDANGTGWIVGVGCATADKAARRSLAGKATRHAAHYAKATRLALLADLHAEVVAEAAAAAFPAVDVVHVDGDGRQSWTVDGVTVHGFGDADPLERLDCLTDSWRSRVEARIAEARGLDIAALRSAARQAGR